MGRPKLALPVGGLTVLAKVVQTLRDGGVERVLVVLGPHVADLRPTAEIAGADVLVLDCETPDMRSTLFHALDWLEQTHAPGPDDAWLLVPADHPAMSAVVVGALLQAFVERPGPS